MDHLGTLIALVILVALSAYFSAAETAFSSLNRVRIKNLASEGNRRAALVLEIEDDFDRFLSTILIGNNIVNITSASLATVLFVVWFPTYGVTISAVVMTLAVLIFGEISPKSLAREYPERFAMAAAPLLRVFLTILRPVNFLFSQWKRFLKLFFKHDEEHGITEEELITIVDEAENGGDIDAHESELIRSAIEFNDLDVEEILVPRVDIVAVEDTATVQELGRTYRENHYTRIPVYHETIDNIVGIIHEKDFYTLATGGARSLKDVTKPVLHTTPKTKISALLRQFQKSKNHMAVVHDEFGGTEGIVTLEDILEELVGEIWDEHDEVVELVHQTNENTWLVAGTENLEDLLESVGLEPDEDCDSVTVGGWIVDRLDHIPAVGESFTYRSLNVTVTQADERRVIEAQIVITPQETETEEE